MYKKRLLLIMIIWVVSLAGCIPGATQTLTPTLVATASPTSSITPSPTPIPSDTPLPPTPIPAASPSPTPSPSVPTLAHFQAGQEITITAIRMLAPTEGWAIGGLADPGDHVLKTYDGGQTWVDVTPPESAPAAGERKAALGYFMDLNTAWVTYYMISDRQTATTVVWRTDDSGQTWSPSQPLDLSDLSQELYQPSHLQFVDNQNGWLLAHVGAGMSHDYVVLFRSADGGLTWTRLLDPYTDGGIQGCWKNGLRFTDPQNGWLTGTCGGVAPGVLLFHSPDAGSTWQQVDLPAPREKPNLFSEIEFACGSHDPTFLTPQTGYIAVSCENLGQTPPTTEHYLYFTQDGGTTWTYTPYPGGSLIFIDPSLGLALGREVYRTQEGGRNWIKVKSVAWDGQFSFVNAQLGWAVARSGEQIALVTTQNGGQTWAELHPRVGP